MLSTLLCVLLLPGCAMRKHAAESAFVQAEADYGRVRDQMTSIAPDQARSIEMAVAAAKEELDHGDAEEAMRMIRDLQTQIRETSERLPAMHAELNAAWKSLSASLPGTLATLNHDLKPANRARAGHRRAALDADRATLLELMDQWEAAQRAMRDGRVAEAVTRAEDVRSRAQGLAIVTHLGS